MTHENSLDGDSAKKTLRSDCKVLHADCKNLNRSDCARHSRPLHWSRSSKTHQQTEEEPCPWRGLALSASGGPFPCPTAGKPGGNGLASACWRAGPWHSTCL